MISGKGYFLSEPDSFLPPTKGESRTEVCVQFVYLGARVRDQGSATRTNEKEKQGCH